ncbi:MAG: S-adenosylmethionine:tRNA ribosyltransferase-isomerase [Bacteroidetes bacterium]|nr:S-adenosylmethionine:tRNA ribosyltransferase-isomerase [Bacteroidota bacterium]
MFTDPKSIIISDFSWNLPAERIALHPLPGRDQSKLLVYDRENIHENIFRNIPDEIPGGSLLIFNTTRVVRARIYMQRASGATVEIFCTDSGEPDLSFPQLLDKKNSVNISAFIGNGKRWSIEEELTAEILISKNKIQLSAKRLSQEQDRSIIQLKWKDENISFAEILETIGKIPLPPYIHREEAAGDAERYQTVFSNEKGSVAAPTAGLHFTENILKRLHDKKIETANVLLHVGAGTFKPVKSETIGGHEMHREMITVNEEVLSKIISFHSGNIVAAGTTSLRTLESIYWFGRQLILEPGKFHHELFVSQWQPYENETEIPALVALRAVLDWMRENNKKELNGYTQLLIAPGYKFRMVNGLVTNFHQPGSTLLLLVAAFVGEDWKKIYDHALANDFRFLSYGDGSLLWREKK